MQYTLNGVSAEMLENNYISWIVKVLNDNFSFCT